MQEVFAIPVVDEIMNNNSNDENNSTENDFEPGNEIINDPEITTSDFDENDEKFNIDKINELFSSEKIV